MPEYRAIKNPAALTGAPLTEEEQAKVDASGVDAAIGTDLTEGASQLDIRYTTTRTLVVAVGAAAEPKTWSFSGAVSPMDCRTWYLAKVSG